MSTQTPTPIASAAVTVMTSGDIAAFDILTAESAIRQALVRLDPTDAAHARRALTALAQITVGARVDEVCRCGEPADALTGRFAGLCWRCRDDQLHAAWPN